MKYRRTVNRKLDDDAAASSAEPDEPVLAGPCWPEEDASLPRVVQRNGHTVLDEGWVALDEDEDSEPAGDDD